MSASIFLALGIGIFIGFSLDGQEIFVEQQQGLISELEQRFVEFKQENLHRESIIDSKERELQMYRHLTEQLLPGIVRGSLRGIRLAIIQHNGETPDMSMVEQLTLAGAYIKSITCLKGDSLTNSVDSTVSRGECPSKLSRSDNVYTRTARDLINAILVGGNDEFLRDKEEADIMSIFGEYSSWIDYFILIGGSSEENRERAFDQGKALIEAIKEYDIPIIGTEKSDCEVSCVKIYIEAGIPSVDNVDSIVGQYSLIKMLQGSTGHYGVKDTAKHFIPIDSTEK